MSTDTPIPNKIGAAFRWTLDHHPWVFFLVAVERLAEGHYQTGFIFGCIFVANLFLASKWDQIAAYFGRSKVTLFYTGLAIVCALGLGFALAQLLGRSSAPQTSVIAPTTDTGRIAWNFEQTAQGLGRFLGVQRQGSEEPRIQNFGAVGKNTSDDPITHFKGRIRSNITNEELPIYIIAENPNFTDPFSRYIPTKPEETFGIPAGAEFDITTFDKPVFESGKDGIPLSKFLRDFAEFTVVLEYDGKEYQRRFTKQEIQKQIDSFHQSVDFNKANEKPHVTRRPNATPPEPMLPFGQPLPPPPNGK